MGGSDAVIDDRFTAVGPHIMADAGPRRNAARWGADRSSVGAHHAADPPPAPRPPDSGSPRRLRPETGCAGRARVPAGGTTDPVSRASPGVGVPVDESHVTGSSGPCESGSSGPCESLARRNQGRASVPASAAPHFGCRATRPRNARREAWLPVGADGLPPSL